MERERDRVKTGLTVAEERTDSARRDADELRREVDELRRDNESLRHECAAVNARGDVAERDREASNRELAQRSEAFRAEIESLKRELDAVKRDCVALRLRADTAEREREAVRAEIALIEGKGDALSGDLRDIKERLQESEKSREKGKEREAVLRDEVAQLRGKCDFLQRERDRLEASAAALSAQITTLEEAAVSMCVCVRERECVCARERK
jgi:chromosome segregation ATPase